MPRGLWTTTVGSFPKPPHLEKARNQFARGEVSAEQLHTLERDATIEVIRWQAVSYTHLTLPTNREV